VNIFSYFAQNFLLPVLAAVFAAVVSLILGGTKWSLKKHSAVTLPLVVIAFTVCWFANRKSEPSQPLGVAGRIVNELNKPVGQADITLDKGSERCLSEDNGNYRLVLTGKVKRSDWVRIHVAKNGYVPADADVEVPSENYVVQLHGQ
jgi:hypothetical protein